MNQKLLASIALFEIEAIGSRNPGADWRDIDFYL